MSWLKLKTPHISLFFLSSEFLWHSGKCSKFWNCIYGFYFNEEIYEKKNHVLIDSISVFTSKCLCCDVLLCILCLILIYFSLLMTFCMYHFLSLTWLMQKSRVQVTVAKLCDVMEQKWWHYFFFYRALIFEVNDKFIKNREKWWRYKYSTWSRYQHIQIGVFDFFNVTKVSKYPLIPHSATTPGLFYIQS